MPSALKSNPLVSPHATSSAGIVAYCALAALAMSYGWGFRGVYGHEEGAMVPGALLGMSLCLACGRADWYSRIPAAGLAGAVGWAFGGSMSYRSIPAYTVSQSFPDVCYGYACLFVVGALWGGIGAAILSLTFTESRRRLQQLAWLVVILQIVWFGLELIASRFPDFYEAIDDISLTRDTSAPTIVVAIFVLGLVWLVRPTFRGTCGFMMALAAGWWLGHLVLVKLTGFHMQPKPGGEYRSDSWAGCTGMLIVLLSYFLYHKNRTGILFSLYGLVAGGLGFAIGNFASIPDKVRWEPFWRHEFLRGFDHWKWAEQSFGLIMGLGIALGTWRVVRNIQAIPLDDDEQGRLRVNDVAAFAILVVIPWMNLSHNVDKWSEQKKLATDLMLGQAVGRWLALLGLMMAGIVIYALVQHRRNRLPLAPATSLGRGQLLFLTLMWVTCIGSLLESLPLLNRGTFFIDWSFWVTCLVCTFLVFRIQPLEPAFPSVTQEEPTPTFGFGFLGVCLLSPLLIVLLAHATIKMQTAPNDGALLRFGPNASHLKSK